MSVEMRVGWIVETVRLIDANTGKCDRSIDKDRCSRLSPGFPTALIQYSH